MRAAAIALLMVMLPAAPSAQPRILDVAPGRTFLMPSAAAAAARPGYVIRIAAGTYEDCAAWRADGLVIEGKDAERVVIGNRTCLGKGVFVVAANDVTVRGVTLRGARSVDGNGAEIRGEGVNLTVERVRFLDNENGILLAGVSRGVLLVRNSSFIGNGSCAHACAHGIYTGPLERLRVERSRLRATGEGHHVKSRAFRTEVLDCDVEDGPEGTASYLIEVPNGGAVLLRQPAVQRPALGQPQHGDFDRRRGRGPADARDPHRIECRRPQRQLSHRLRHESHGNARHCWEETVCRPLSSLCAAMDGSRPNQERPAEWSWEHPLEWCSVMSTSQAFNQGNSNAPARLCLRPIPEAMQCSTVRLPARESSSLVMPSRGAAE